MSTMKAPSMALLGTFSPVIRSEALSWIARGCLAQRQSGQIQQKAQFSSTESRKKKGGGPKKDPRITRIRYFLDHPLTPRPLRFSRNRALRHWTIHRAWQRYQDKLRIQKEMDLERQYNAMAGACEALRLIDNNGLTEDESRKFGVTPKPGEQKEMGRLYRIAMMKHGVWSGVPIEYARMQTETPGRDGWNHAWTR